MKIENTVVFGFGPALKGMRNSWDSWDKSDTDSWHKWSKYFSGPIISPDCPVLGPTDMGLCKKLIKAGSSHRKFLRQIQIWTELTLPRYIWTEMDTYHAGTVRNSCSTIHTILKKEELTSSDFAERTIKETIKTLNMFIQMYRAGTMTKTEALLAIKKNLPESFLQLSTYSMNYETAMNIYFQRRHHILPEWNENSEQYSICKWIKDLPYMREWLDD